MPENQGNQGQSGNPQDAQGDPRSNQQSTPQGGQGFSGNEGTGQPWSPGASGEQPQPTTGQGQPSFQPGEQGQGQSGAAGTGTQTAKNPDEENDTAGGETSGGGSFQSERKGE